ncbi:MAG: hypothetical protein ACP5UM_13900, partial [Anaerolineae bacterium]
IRCVLVQGGARPQVPDPQERRPPPPPEPPPGPPAAEVDRPVASAEGPGEGVDRAYRAVASDPLIQEAVTRYGAQVVDIVSREEEGPWGSGEKALEAGEEFPEADEEGVER